MNKIIQFIVIMIASATIQTYAEVHFELTNKSTQPIWVRADVNEEPFTGDYSNRFEQEIAPNSRLSQKIANENIEITISVVNPHQRNGNDRYRTYIIGGTKTNNKNKFLIWNHTSFPENPLFPESEKHFMGLIKSKKPNNVLKEEIILKKYKNL